MVSVCSSTIMAEKISWCCALLMAMLLVLNSCEDGEGEFRRIENERGIILKKPCDEIYVVKEGETLHTISEKCGDPFIVEQNPHINDPDDVFPGLVIKITPFNFRSGTLTGRFEPKMAEICCLKEALCWVYLQEYSNVKIESDAKTVVDGMFSSAADRSEFGSWLKSCRS